MSMPNQNFQGNLPGDFSSHGLLLETYYNSHSSVSPAFQQLQNQLTSVCSVMVVLKKEDCRDVIGPPRRKWLQLY